MPAARRALLVLVAAATFGLLAAWVKDEGGDGLTTASHVRAAIGNLSSPWLLVGLLAGAAGTGVGGGALIGLAATMAALTGFYALTGAVIGLDGQHFPRSALLWMSANRVYYAAGVASGLVCGAVGGWWRARHGWRTSPARTASVLVGSLLVAEPLVLVGMGLLFPHGAVQADHAPAPARLLLSLLGSWTLTSSHPPVQLAVYAGEAATGLILLLVDRVRGRRTPSPAANRPRGLH
jgi:hypothetical protein